MCMHSLLPPYGGRMRRLCMHIEGDAPVGETEASPSMHNLLILPPCGGEDEEAVQVHRGGHHATFKL